MDLFLVTLASLLAGFVDAIVGGGGLILLPALFAAYPLTPAATLLGSNKSASIWGTAFASLRYTRQVPMHWRALAPAALLTFAGALAGAWLVTLASNNFLRKLLPFVLLAVLIYTLSKKELGRSHAPRLSPRAEMLVLGAAGGLIGFYDGFFGPGTGSFFIFLMVRVLGYDFLHASASAKLLNVSSNLAAILLFALKGHVWWRLAAPLALANIIGSLLGARMALRHGVGFVRAIFLVVVTTMILKTSYDAFLR